LEDESGYLAPKPQRQEFATPELDLADVAAPDSYAVDARWRLEACEHGLVTLSPEELPKRNTNEPYYQNVD
jgi:hypothetical protein